MELVHADEALLVLVKPAGMLAVPGRGEPANTSLAAHVQQRWPDALVVHRLDMATSGLMLFARGAAAQSALCAAFRERRVDKRYEAIVAGIVDSERGEIELPLADDWPQRPRQQVHLTLGRPALTRWRVLARDTDLARSRLELEPITGRTHQLRVHLSAIGHPIVGDALYGAPMAATAAAADPLAPAIRMMLHATRLRLSHPLHGAPLEFCSATPF